uniref:G_PROTEIN_RECEP_F1_2 domain-containing protein n=2 Tax=Macrostomum lignano TaxID=282301 RepID=A0A1I8GSN5_9PLAT
MLSAYMRASTHDDKTRISFTQKQKSRVNRQSRLRKREHCLLQINLAMSQPETDNGSWVPTSNCSRYNFSLIYYLDQRLSGRVHGYLSSSICIVGIMLNIIMCVVLTRKTMRNPFNVILTGISVCDTIKMTTYAYYAIYMYIISEPIPDAIHSKLAMLLILAHNVITIIGHVIATLFTVALAFFRFIAVYFPTEGPTWCSMKRTKYCLIGIVVVSVLATLPNSMSFKLKQSKNTDSWWFDVYDWVKRLKIEKLNMYIYGIFVKMFSSLLICIFSGMLLYALRQVRIRRKRLKADRVRCKEARNLREHTRRTILLVAVVFSFTVTEFPQGCLNLGAAMDDCIFKVIYFQLGNLMDILVILNSATNIFWLYGMSSQFRETFVSTFAPKCVADARKLRQENRHRKQQQLLLQLHGHQQQQPQPMQQKQVNYLDIVAANRKQVTPSVANISNNNKRNGGDSGGGDCVLNDNVVPQKTATETVTPIV